ncbi:MAG: TetR/AcrR family transcriptional regulator [Candidatus Schekmanbacteria bacterium]|nr:TetR/AcrR family transcriptional regulator [Candidatus Schekmanbacteria bacterium]
MVTKTRKTSDQERKERTRQSLLAAAARVFLGTGYHKTVISDIVAEAGVGQGTFYRFFRDKEDVFSTLVDGFIERMLAQFADMSANLPKNAEEYRAASLAATKKLAAIFEENRELVLFFLREAPTISPAMAAKLDAMLNRFAALAGFYLQHAILMGFARHCNTEVVGQALIGIALRLVETWAKGRFATSALDRVIEEIVDLAFFGFGDPRMRLTMVPSGEGENR